ncbi:superfamily II DNA or RNA helicase/HKD family nuclease [Actinopolymorpha rutila]|uniref:Superfamily II DNA or RNA helicase/HKD family nuclease n=2 Tax=Actinopolymorpha rutila TaxID=446787 RepID=A0A852ZNX5_9ACTN|nr:superfamily II DNA or RNA helicase/HKD family nuclease [Actinopolymorpha rutila]
MDEGLFETLVTTGLRAKVEMLAAEFKASTAVVDKADQPEVLARYLREVATRVLSSKSDLQERVQLLNEALRILEPDGADPVVEPPQQLTRVSRLAAPGVLALPDTRPTTPLSDAALLTNSPGEPSLGSELRSEIDTADGVDLLCAFVKWHGLRVLESQLALLRERGVPLRVITTAYMGATDRPALDRLVRHFGATVKVQYDIKRTRLHAKAWLFRRRTGFDTAYVGSSNLSHAALLDGVEWNVRLSQVATPSLMAKFAATFDTYWNDATFEDYDPDRDRDRLDDALAEASGRRTTDRVTVSLSGLEVRPYPHQAEMLEELESERVVHGRHRNLVVAATGTGKTVVAALDYRRLSLAAEAAGKPRPSLLFVAHRREILQQSLRTYREVLADASFGELYVGDARPERWRHVFASIQSLSAYGVANIPPDAYEIVVVDEFHHAEARTYRTLLSHLAPRELLGLTATPERTDGIDVRRYFDGRTAAELRLWDALEAELLCPFHYFGIADNTKLTDITWARGRYDEAALSNLYTGNDARTAIVLRELHDKIADISSMRALGFCVSVAHADYMADAFNKAGIPAQAVSGATGQRERENALNDLRDRRVNVLFAADLFNEGLDIPQVDTVLFLRPTESATIFLQQLGRGLRHASDKPVLTVLDYVGHQHKNFRFDQRYSALTGATRRGLKHQIERGFPFLPSGCQIVLDEEAQEIVLDNIRAQVDQRWRYLVQDLRLLGDCDLQTYLSETQLELSDVLRKGSKSWTQLRQDAGAPTRHAGPRQAQLLKRIRALAHVDDPDRRRAYADLLADGAPNYDDLDVLRQRWARMLFFSLWPDGGGFASYAAGLAALRDEPAVRDELLAVLALSFEQARHVPVRLRGGLAQLPLRVHAQYQREEILAALDYANLQRRPASFQAGVLRAPDWNADAFLVTLRKSESDFSPTTMYRDYAISPTLFHWESQSSTSTASPTGQRYLQHSALNHNILLFTRERQSNDLGTAPYLLLGTAQYVSHTGERPIAITWRLDHAMPTDAYTHASVAAG